MQKSRIRCRRTLIDGQTSILRCIPFHASVTSNNAEPMRTIVAPSSIAISKSALMPIDSSLSPAASPTAVLQMILGARASRQICAGLRIAACESGNAHQAAYFDVF